MKKIMWVDPETEEVLVNSESVLSAVDGSPESDYTGDGDKYNDFGGDDAGDDIEV